MDIQIDYQSFEEELSCLPLADLVSFVLPHFQVPTNTQVSLTFVSNEEIAHLNERYRKKQGPTDVLSFECDGLEDAFGGVPSDEPFVLGDIIIATEVACEQAHEYGTTFAEEINVLVVHGLCHLAGYDHETDEEAAEMEPLEEKLLQDWNKYANNKNA